MTTSSPRSAAPLHLSFKPSRFLAAALAAGHLIAGACALLNELPLWVRFLLIAAIVLSYRYYRRTLIEQPAIAGLSFAADGAVFVKQSTGVEEAELEQGALVTPWLVILPLKLPGGRKTILICRDGLDAESFRCLRVYLRCHGWHPKES